MRTLLKWLGAILAIAIAVALVVLLANYGLLKRYFTYPPPNPATSVNWYSPLETVHEGPLANLAEGTPEGAGISAATVRSAIDYGRSTDSVALLVLHAGKLIIEHYWPGYGVDTRVETASMHKSVLSLLVGIARDEGHIDSLDDPVSKYLQEWTGRPEGEIRIRQLLTMASGLETAPFSANPFSRGMQMLLGSEIDDTALEYRLAATPGSEFVYNNVNSQLLGMVVEAATGQRYAHYLSDRLWSRIGAPRAFVWLDRSKGMARTFCCLQTSARGWLSVGRLLLEGGAYDGRQIVPADYLREALSPSSTNPNYGFQIWLGSPHQAQRRYTPASPLAITHSEPYLADDLFFFDGYGGQRVYVVPSAELVIVRVGTTSLAWDDSILPNLFLRDLLGDR